jgi:hypothetical protein
VRWSDVILLLANFILVPVNTIYGGPVGWGVGAVYFIGDIYGWWGNWGEPTPIKPTKK